MRALEDHYWWFVSRRRLARMLLDHWAPAVRSVLDLGCGTGAFLQELSETKEPVGVDFSAHAVEFCRERGLRLLTQADAEALPFASASFGAVVSLDTLEHVHGDVRAVTEVARVLEPGGVFIVNVPAYRWLWGPHDEALMHHRRYTRRQVRDLLETAGLKVECASYSVFFLFLTVVVIRALDKFRRGPATVRLPKVPDWANRCLVILQDIEARLILTVPLPWGSSVVAVARKVKD